MESSRKLEQIRRTKRALRVRSTLHGTKSKPRLCVVKTNKHIHVQLIDDDAHGTLASVSTASKELRSGEHGRKSKASAHVLGEMMAEKATQLGVSSMVFDRGFSKYHGILKALADAIRAKGLQI